MLIQNTGIRAFSAAAENSSFSEIAAKIGCSRRGAGRALHRWEVYI